MRVLFTTQPGFGMVGPLLPFARALTKVGHDVVFACAASFRPEVEAAGFRSRPAGIDWRADQLTQAFPDAPPPGPARSEWVNQLFRSTTARAMVPDLLAIADAWRPDLVVREGIEYGGCLAAELLGLPHATAGSHWFRPQAPLNAPLDALRAELGLAADPAGTELYRYLALAPMPPSWVAPDEEAPPTAHFLRPASLNGDDASEVLTWLDDLPADRPLVHATLGTTEVTRLPGLYEAILAGLRDEPVNVVVGIGSHRSPDEFGPQPPHVHLAPHLPHETLLPRCDLVITHGGFGTITRCLAAGVPMVVIPVQGDQPRNARRCADLGVGRVVEPDERTPQAIRTAARAVLGDPAYRYQAAGVRDEIASLPTMNAAVALLELLASERRPVLRDEGTRQHR